MSHRLFRPLVLSSAVLLEACGGSQSASESTPDRRAASNDTSGSEEPTSDASEPSEIASVDAEAQAAVRDVRTCEPGWPTTKGASLLGTFQVVRDGLRYGCRNGDSSPEAPDLELCCVLGSESGSPTAEPAS